MAEISDTKVHFYNLVFCLSKQSVSSVLSSKTMNILLIIKFIPKPECLETDLNSYYPKLDLLVHACQFTKL